MNPAASVGKFKEIYRQQSDPPQAILPFGGVVHSRRVKLVTQRPNASVSVEEGITLAPPPSKLITYEEIAIYKRHSKVKLKHYIKSSQPLNPGDLPPPNANGLESSVVLETLPCPEVIEVNEEPKESKETKSFNEDNVKPIKEKTNCQPLETTEDLNNNKPTVSLPNNDQPNETANEAKAKETVTENTVAKSEDNTVPKPTTEITEENKNKNDAPVNSPEKTVTTTKKSKIKNKFVQRKGFVKTGTEKLPVVVIPVLKGKYKSSVSLNNKERELLISKAAFLKNTLPNDIPTTLLQSAKQSIVNSIRKSNVKNVNPKLKGSQQSNRSQKPKNNTNSFVDKSLTKGEIPTEEEESGKQYNEGKTEQVYFFQEHTEEDNEKEKQLYSLSDVSMNIIDQDNVTRSTNECADNSLMSVVAKDLDVEKWQGLWPEPSGFTFIGESSADRKLENILNSPQYLNAIGKNDRNVPLMFKAFVGGRLSCE